MTQNKYLPTTTHGMLTHLMEEMAECQKTLAKIKRFGFFSEWDGKTNIRQLNDEFVDVLKTHARLMGHIAVAMAREQEPSDFIPEQFPLEPLKAEGRKPAPGVYERPGLVDANAKEALPERPSVPTPGNFKVGEAQEIARSLEGKRTMLPHDLLEQGHTLVQRPHEGGYEDIRLDDGTWRWSYGARLFVWWPRISESDKQAAANALGSSGRDGIEGR